MRLIKSVFPARSPVDSVFKTAAYIAVVLSLATSYTIRTIAQQPDPRIQVSFPPAVINSGRVGNLPSGDNLSIGTGAVVAGSMDLNAGPTWTAGAGAPSGACSPGSHYSNTSGGTLTTMYLCTASAVWLPVTTILPGSLTMTNATQTAAVNLSSVGTGQIDWEAEATDTSTRVYDAFGGTVNGKLTGGGMLLSPGLDAAGISGTVTSGTSAFTFSSTAADTLALVALSSTSGAELSGAVANATGMRFAAPMTNTQRVLRLYMAHKSSTMVCTAHLQDGSATDQTTTSTAASGTTVQEVYTITATAGTQSTYVSVACIITATTTGPLIVWFASVLSAT